MRGRLQANNRWDTWKQKSYYLFQEPWPKRTIPLVQVALIFSFWMIIHSSHDLFGFDSRRSWHFVVIWLEYNTFLFFSSSPDSFPGNNHSALPPLLTKKSLSVVRHDREIIEARKASQTKTNTHPSAGVGRFNSIRFSSSSQHYGAVFIRRGYFTSILSLKIHTILICDKVLRQYLFTWQQPSQQHRRI